MKSLEHTTGNRTRNLQVSSSMVDTRVSQSLVADGTLKSYRSTEDPYLSTTSQIKNEIPAFIYLLCTLHVKNEMTYL